MQYGAHNPSRQDAIGCSHIEGYSHRKGNGKNHCIGRRRNGGLPQGDTRCSYQSNGGSIHTFENGLERIIVTQREAQRDTDPERPFPIQWHPIQVLSCPWRDWNLHQIERV